MLNKYVVAMLFLSITPSYAEIDLRGSAGLETRYFTKGADFQTSFFIEPEGYWESNASSWTIKPFVRVDSLDSARTHADLREAFYQYAEDNWELRAGVNKIFWGVTESQHLVDVINQTDYLEGFDGEDKLGQPLIQLTRITSWGVIDAFLMPYFRERKFPGENGHFNFSATLVTDTGPELFNASFEQAQYESSQDQHHLDTALRYSHTAGSWDFGISYFSGTQRDPLLQVTNINLSEKIISFTPFYSQIEHLGLDVQATFGAWLWKLEALSRRQEGEDSSATVSGFEYTLYGVNDQGSDLGLLMELNWDERSKSAPTPLQKDLFVGGRFTWNDEQSSELLVGLIQDLDHSQSYVARLEASRRLWTSYRFNVEAWIFNSATLADPVYNIRNEDFAQLSLEKFF